MNWTIPLSTSQAGRFIDLTDSNLYIAEGVLIASTTFEPIILHGGISHEVAVYGDVVGVTGGIETDNDGAGVRDLVTIGSHGRIEVLTHDTWAAVMLNSESFTLVNAGVLTGTSAGLSASVVSGTSNITNTGTIEGIDWGITRGYQPGQIDTVNTGTISGTVAYDATGSLLGVDHIVNAGKLLGAVKLGGGDDYLDTSKGTLTGAVDLGDGADTFKGNAASNKVTGGLGLDTMTGGKGADTFYFTAATDTGLTKATADRITDFTHSQKDRIDLKAIDAKSAGGSNDAFTWIGTAGFHHKQGELHYTRSGGNAYVSGDIDGNGIADFTIRLDHVASLVKGDFVL